MIKSIFKFFFLHTIPFLFVCLCMGFYVNIMLFAYDKPRWEHFVSSARHFFGYQEMQAQIQEDIIQIQEEIIEPKLYRAKASILNVRQLPSIDSPIIDRIYKGQEVLIFENKNSWGKLQRGYVFLDPKNIQKVSNKQDLEQESTYKVKVAVGNVREKPLANAKIIAKVYRDEILKIQEIGNGWGKIEQGYIALKLVERIDE
ncbi:MULTISPECIES: SH3 domain-containing protein [unclassified Helicobacter]|uniref:SH3 domain-containing protein n=1 Tax=unclassified Helicobacter TaxID=2593540 RepID=UPI000CF1225F|nr:MULTISPECIES: SH3 domain-containing protein [unclassified Helicobacter]